MNKHKKNLYVRADGDFDTGYGHVIRSLALAELLKEKFVCHFIIHAPDDFLLNKVVKAGVSLINLPAFDTLENEALHIIRNICCPNDFVVLDGYKFTEVYQRIIRESCGKLICIDDVFRTHFYADVVINHAQGVNERYYDREWYTRLYLGAKFAILRQPFYKIREKSSELGNGKHRVFINMGGTDPGNYTVKALRLALKLVNIGSIDIVIGSLYQNKRELLQLIQRHSSEIIRIHVNLDATGMARLMRKSSIGICAASSVSYEYARTGGILFLYKTATNQKYIYSSLCKSLVGFPVTTVPEKIATANNEEWHKNYIKRKKIFFSGNPSENLKGIFERLLIDSLISVRMAQDEDVMTYFYWANEKEVRKNSVNQLPISLEDHRQWYRRRLQDSKTFMYLFHKEDIPIGQVRIDLVDNEHAEVGFSLDVQCRGKGYSEIILRKAIAKFKLNHSRVVIQAVIKKYNAASLKAFLNNSFEKQKDIKINKEAYYRLLLNK